MRYLLALLMSETSDMHNIYLLSKKWLCRATYPQSLTFLRGPVSG